ncbi:MAG TPA: hypothetical protein VIM11_07740 [Tepidisphaeraceae bacterium]|jgi:hypothetical protein
MRHIAIVLSVLWLSGSTLPSGAADLTKIDRSLVKEPKYNTEPYYALLVFGPNAEKRVWLVVDGDVLYVDRNSNGDLTEANERVALDIGGTKKLQEPWFYKGTNSFDIGEIAGLSLHLDFWVRDKDFVPKTDDDKRILKDHQKKGWEFATLRRPASKATLWQAVTSSTPDSLWRYGSDTEMQVIFSRRIADAQICHFDGPLTFSTSGIVLLDRDSDANSFRVEIGTFGLPARGRDDPVFAELANWDVPANVHPKADFEFAHKDATQPPIKLQVVLDQRCCGSLFYGPVRVPPEAATGNAKVTVSFPAWKQGNVAPATFEVRIRDATEKSSK